jgi:hypothetical protein
MNMPTVTLPNRVSKKRLRGYTRAGDFVELGAACTNCARIVEPQDISTDVDSDAARFQVICPKCHDIIFRIAVTVPDPLDDVEAAS